MLLPLIRQETIHLSVFSNLSFVSVVRADVEPDDHAILLDSESAISIIYAH
jgi:hypothetical protein